MPGFSQASRGLRGRRRRAGRARPHQGGTRWSVRADTTWAELHSGLRLWDDSPTANVLLGSDAVVAPVLEASATPDSDPLTVECTARGVGSRSAPLPLLHDQLADDDHYLVIDTDPRRFDDQTDVRGAITSS